MTRGERMDVWPAQDARSLSRQYIKSNTLLCSQWVHWCGVMLVGKKGRGHVLGPSAHCERSGCSQAESALKSKG